MLPTALRKPWHDLLTAAQVMAPGFHATLYVADPELFPAPRDMAVCELTTLTVLIAPKLARQAAARIRGVLAHELGHALLAWFERPDHSEREADATAEALLGVQISYDCGLVQTTGTGTRPRPAQLA